MIRHLNFLTALLLLTTSCANKQSSDEHSPQSSLADLKVYDGLDVGLFASEPMFSNPTNMSIDSRGRVWVTEAYNYRNKNNPKNSQSQNAQNKKRNFHTSNKNRK